MRDAFISFAAISGTYMFIGSIVIFILFKMNHPPLLHICRVVTRATAIVLILLFAINALCHSDYSLVFFALLIGNLMCMYILPKQK